MALRTKANITGDEGEHLAALVLSRIATVNPFSRDQGLDFVCELREEPSFTFYVQAKASGSPVYGSDTIDSLPVDRKTIDTYWLRKPDPVFVLMSDTRARRTYYLPITDETYQPGDPNAKTHTFVIPLRNEIAVDNIGDLVSEVTRLQRQLTQEEALAWIEEFQQHNPLLYQDIGQIDRFLDVMEGSDSSAQARARSAIESLSKAGKLDSMRLVDGLVRIFRSCKDRIVQSYILDIFVFLNIPEAIREILQRIRGNLELREYREWDPYYRHYWTSFLFSALVKLEAKNILPDMRFFFGHPEPHVVQDAARVCGELRLRGGDNDLVALLSHPENNVRKTAARALAKYGFKKTVGSCVRILRQAESSAAIDGAIRTLAELRDCKQVSIVIRFAKHSDPRVRQAVAYYLGVVEPQEYADVLIDLMVDENLDVRSEARRALADAQEVLILPRLEAAFNQGNEMVVASLLGALQGCATEAAKPLLLRIYLEDDGIPANYRIRDRRTRTVRTGAVELKTQVLDILKRFDVPEIHDDIVRQIKEASLDLSVKYIIAAKDLKIQDAFDILTALDDDRLRQWPQFVVSALLGIDRDRTVNWTFLRLKQPASLAVCLLCCDIIYKAGLQRDAAELVNAQLWHHFQNPICRLETRIYHYVQEYQVISAVPLIIKDLDSGWYRHAKGKSENALLSKALQTLAAMKDSRGRDYMIALLPRVGSRLRMDILRQLADIGDPLSAEAIRGCLSDPEPNVRRLAYLLRNQSRDVSPTTKTGTHFE